MVMDVIILDTAIYKEMMTNLLGHRRNDGWSLKGHWRIGFRVIAI